MSLNRLKLNEDKTDALLVSSKDAVRKKYIPSMPLMEGDAPISPSPVVLNLGVRLDSHLTMESQITSLAGRLIFISEELPGSGDSSHALRYVSSSMPLFYLNLTMVTVF